jgi:hypothetical protein
MADHNSKDNEVKFTVNVENVSSKDLQTAADGSKWHFALSPGFWAVHRQKVRFFNEGQRAALNGLEAQAEDWNSRNMVDFLMDTIATCCMAFSTYPMARKRLARLASVACMISPPRQTRHEAFPNHDVCAIAV